MKLGVALAMLEDCFCDNYFVFEVDRDKTHMTHQCLAMEDTSGYLVRRTL